MVTSRLWIANRIAVIALKNAAEARMKISSDILISHSSRSRIVIEISLSPPDYHAPASAAMFPIETIAKLAGLLQLPR